MYLSLKMILLGAAFASAIPIANNGTNNVTLFQQPTVSHQSILPAGLILNRTL